MKSYNKILLTIVLAAGLLVSCKDDCEKNMTGTLQVITGTDVCNITYEVYLDGELIGTVEANDTLSVDGIPFGPHPLVLKVGVDEFASTSVSIFSCNTTTYIYDEFCGPSDKRYKKNISSLLFNMDDFMQINAYVYDYKTEEFDNLPSGRHQGFMAQEMLGIYPQVVQENSHGYYAINYMEMIPVLTKAIQEQQRQIKDLQQEVAVLKSTKDL